MPYYKVLIEEKVGKECYIWGSDEKVAADIAGDDLSPAPRPESGISDISIEVIQVKKTTSSFIRSQIPTEEMEKLEAYRKKWK